MADKPKLKYHIINARNPHTGAALLRPVITDRTTMSLDQVVKYALNAGYVRGQYNDMRGVLNGFIEAIQQLGKDGCDVSLKNWLRVHGELTGHVGEERVLTSDNTFRVRITALTDLKREIDEFSFENVDTAEHVAKVDVVSGVGDLPNIWTKSKDLIVTGKYMTFVAANGDTCTASYDGLETPISLTTNETDYAHTKFAWNAALAEVEAGEPIEIKLTLHPDGAEKPAQVFTRVVVLKAAA